MVNFEFLIMNDKTPGNSKFNIQNSKFSVRGSVLIASLWALSVLSVFVTRLAFEGAQHALLMKRELSNLEAKADFLSGIHLASQAIFSDPDPHTDSLLDPWQGTLPLPSPWKEKLSIRLEDEESKLHLNFASEALLRAFLKGYEEEGNSLKGERKDFVKAILKRRAKDRIVSLEELYLLEGIEKEDLEKLRPFVTVYPELPQMNLNTIGPVLLESLIESLPGGDDRAKDELQRKLLEHRKKVKEGEASPFQSEELDPNPFLQKLKLSPSVPMISLVNQFLSLLSSDSRTYRLQMKSSSGKEAEAVLKERAEGLGMEVVSWHEE